MIAGMPTLVDIMAEMHQRGIGIRLADDGQVMIGPTTQELIAHYTALLRPARAWIVMLLKARGN